MLTLFVKIRTIRFAKNLNVKRKNYFNVNADHGKKIVIPTLKRKIRNSTTWWSFLFNDPEVPVIVKFYYILMLRNIDFFISFYIKGRNIVGDVIVDYFSSIVLKQDSLFFNFRLGSNCELRNFEILSSGDWNISDCGTKIILAGSGRVAGREMF